MNLWDLIKGKKPVPAMEINDLLQTISRRAERLGPKEQVDTFVSTGGITAALLNPDNRVIYGRRGTGKTHVMSYVADQVQKRGDLSIFVDVRTMGSNSYIYGDETRPVAERATLLLRDFLTAVQNAMLEAVTAPKSGLSVGRFAPVIDRLGEAVKLVLVLESVEYKESGSKSGEMAGSLDTTGKASATGISGEAKGGLSGKRSTSTSTERTEKSTSRLSVNIGDVSRAFSDLANLLGRRLWIFIDEWGTIPDAIQPYFADFLKRVCFPERNITVQIAAIEQRSNFRLGSGASGIGIELGSDAFADINLDDHLVFENSPDRSIRFFKEMFFRHLKASGDGAPHIKDGDDFIRQTFSQVPAFRELVRASEGVPRDALNIIQLAALRAQANKISIPNIRDAAKDWYERDKTVFVNANAEADRLLQWIIQKVVAGRKARAFLVRSDARSTVLDSLFDERILHVARKSYSAKAEPGVRYTVWKLDYGSYVDLINTSNDPKNFLDGEAEVDETDGLVVPEDDLRAIRRAILDLADFEASALSSDQPANTIAESESEQGDKARMAASDKLEATKPEE